MRRNRGNGWEDLGPTAPTESQLPPDVRLPFRSNDVREHTGARYRTLDTELCVIDRRPSELGQSSEADVLDDSRHNGMNHVWTAQPHAKTSPGSNPSLHTGELVRGDRWAPDDKSVTGYRLISIEQVTLPHDCENHLPETGGVLA